MNGPLLVASSADGMQLWTVPSEDEEEHDDDRIATFAMARLAGVVIAAGVGPDVTVTGHDLITGEELWRLPQGWPDTFAAAGTTLLRLENGQTIAAMDVHTGAELWRLEMGDEVQGVVAADDAVIVLDDDGLTRFAWP